MSGSLQTASGIHLQRINFILGMMRNSQWSTDVVAIYKDEWNISEPELLRLVGEAWRRFCLEANQPDEMRPEIAGLLRKNILKADQLNHFKVVGTLADVWSKVIGARAPERHEHAVVVAQFDSLSKQGKVVWLEERIAKLEEAKRALLESDE